MEPIHREGFFNARDNLRLYWQSFVPREPRAEVGLVHGYGEHSNRYLPLLRHLSGLGYAVHALDYRGHGQADGRRGHVDHFTDYLDDVGLFVERIAAQAGGRKLFLLGHSLGGLILARFLLDRTAPAAGAIFASPYLRLAIPPPRLKVAAARLVGRVLPWLPVDNGLRIDQLTRDPEMQRATERDPLYNRIATPRWFEESSHAQVEVLERAGEIRLPSLVMIPEADTVAAPAATHVFFDGLGSAEKELRLYPGARHELFNELPETRQQAMSDLSDWLSARGNGPWIR